MILSPILQRNKKFNCLYQVSVPVSESIPHNSTLHTSQGHHVPAKRRYMHQLLSHDPPTPGDFTTKAIHRNFYEDFSRDDK